MKLRLLPMRTLTLVQAFALAEEARSAISLLRPAHAKHGISSASGFGVNDFYLRALCGCGERLSISSMELCAGGL